MDATESAWTLIANPTHEDADLMNYMIHDADGWMMQVKLIHETRMLYTLIV